MYSSLSSLLRSWIADRLVPPKNCVAQIIRRLDNLRYIRRSFNSPAEIAVRLYSLSPLLLDWLKRCDAKTPAGTVHDFHNYNHGDAENGFIINRQNGIRTFSITQAVVKKDTVSFLHTDLLQHKEFEETLTIRHNKIISEEI